MLDNKLIRALYRIEHSKMREVKDKIKSNSRPCGNKAFNKPPMVVDQVGQLSEKISIGMPAKQSKRRCRVEPMSSEDVAMHDSVMTLRQPVVDC
jgi:hypothetical protein